RTCRSGYKTMRRKTFQIESNPVFSKNFTHMKYGTNIYVSITFRRISSKNISAEFSRGNGCNTVYGFMREPHQQRKLYTADQTRRSNYLFCITPIFKIRTISELWMKTISQIFHY